MGPPVSVLVRLTDISSVRGKEGGGEGATAASHRGLTCRGAGLHHRHEAEKDRKAIQVLDIDHKRIGLWQLRLKYRGQPFASLRVPRGAGRCRGMWRETASLYRPSDLIPKRMSMNVRIPRHVAKIGRAVSRRILYRLNLNPRPALKQVRRANPTASVQVQLQHNRGSSKP